MENFHQESKLPHTLSREQIFKVDQNVNFLPQLQLICFQALIQTHASRCVHFLKENEYNGNAPYSIILFSVSLVYFAHIANGLPSPP
jgi:hypothetical protein